MTTFIQARNYYRGRRKKIRLVVWHDMESPESHTAAENVAAWFAGPTAPRASAHVCADDNSVVQCVRLVDTAWHCPNANSDGVGYEQAGIRNQGRAGWRDTFSLATIRQLCGWHVRQPELRHIPDRFLTDEQLADGVTAGHTTHEQCTRVLGGGTHTDPGPDFPKDYVLEQLVAARGRLVPPVAAPADRWLRFTNPRLTDQPGRHDVSNLHNALIAISANNRDRLGDDLVHHVYGMNTAAVVHDYQLHRGITDERGVGPKTLARIRSEVH
jgi:hypothetical protein